MKTVGIKQLKARLSEYMRAVRQGEVFLVTDRDMVVAELRPPGSTVGATAGPMTLDARLNALSESGEAVLPSASKDGWDWRPAGLRLSTSVVTKVLDEVRSDRDANH